MDFCRKFVCINLIQWSDTLSKSTARSTAIEMNRTKRRRQKNTPFNLLLLSLSCNFPCIPRNGRHSFFFVLFFHFVSFWMSANSLCRYFGISSILLNVCFFLPLLVFFLKFWNLLFGLFTLEIVLLFVSGQTLYMCVMLIFGFLFFFSCFSGCSFVRRL